MRWRGEIIGKLRAGRIRRGIREMRESESVSGLDRIFLLAISVLSVIVHT
jgi:hypothetical protein